MRNLSTSLLLIAGLLLLVGAQPAAATTVTLDQIDRGWFNDSGAHNPANKNTITGQNGSGTDLYHSFFVFDLAGVPTVSQATLRLELEEYFGPDPSETFDVYDVSATAAELGSVHLDGSASGLAIYADLGSGPTYAWEITVTPSDVGTVLEMTLGAQALTDINANLGGTFAVGLRLRDPYTLPSGDEAIRFSWSDEARIHELVLETGPVSIESVSWADVKAQYRPGDE